MRSNGYSVIQAQDKGEVLARDHPVFAAGSEYTIEIFELPKK